MNLGRSSFKMFLSRSGNSLLFFAGITLFARWLDPGEIGVFFTFFALSGILSIPANAGIRGALEKRLSEGQNPEEMLGTALAFKFGMLAVVCSLLLLGGPLIDELAGMQIATLLVVFIIIKEFSRFYLGVLRGELRVGETASVEFFRRVVWIGSSALLIQNGFGAEGLIIGAIISRAFEFFLAYAKASTGIGRPSVAALHSLFAFSKYDTILSVGGRVYQWMDILVIGFFLTQSHVGGYEMAWRVSLLVLLVSKSLELTLFPQISQWDATASRDRISGTVSTALRYTLFVSVPALAGSLLYAEDILRYLFGPEYVFASLVLVVLMVEKLFQSVNDVVGSTVRALDRVDIAAYITVFTVGVNLVLSPILVVSIGVVGAAIATGFAWFLNLLLHVRYLKRMIAFDIPYRFAGWYVVASAVMGGVLIAVAGVWPVTSAVSLVGHITIGIAAYSLTLVVIPNVREEIILPGVRTLVT